MVDDHVEGLGPVGNISSRTCSSCQQLFVGFLFCRFFSATTTCEHVTSRSELRERCPNPVPHVSGSFVVLRIIFGWITEAAEGPFEAVRGYEASQRRHFTISGSDFYSSWFFFVFFGLKSSSHGSKPSSCGSAEEPSDRKHVAVIPSVFTLCLFFSICFHKIHQYFLYQKCPFIFVSGPSRSCSSCQTETINHTMFQLFWRSRHFLFQAVEDENVPETKIHTLICQ